MRASTISRSRGQERLYSPDFPTYAAISGDRLSLAQTLLYAPPNTEPVVGMNGFVRSEKSTRARNGIGNTTVSAQMRLSTVWPETT